VHSRPREEACLVGLALELVFVDGPIAGREKRILDELHAALAIDDDTAIRIVEVLLIKAGS
jgi:hypothetical protein